MMWISLHVKIQTTITATPQKLHQHLWCFQANSSCYWASGWHFQTTVIYILSNFWASGIWHINVTISITERQYISLDVQDVRDALHWNCSDGARRLTELSLKLWRLNVIFLGLICSFTLNVLVLFLLFFFFSTPDIPIDWFVQIFSSPHSHCYL